MLQNRQVVAILTLFLSIAVASPSLAQDIDLRFSGSDSWYLTERSNWSAYVNGVYVGLTHREVHSRLKAGPALPTGREYSGYFYKITETNKDARTVALPVDASIETRFIQAWNGSMAFSLDGGYPEYRNFPVFPSERVAIGSSWVAPGTRCIDPRNDGNLTDLPILAEYRLTGESSLEGEDVWQITAKFATRYPPFQKPARNDPSLTKASGTHDAQILVRKFDGAVLVIMDRMDDTFTYRDGTTLRYKGNTAIFAKAASSTEDIAQAFDRASIIADAPVHGPVTDSQGSKATVPGGLSDSVSLGLPATDPSTQTTRDGSSSPLDPSEKASRTDSSGTESGTYWITEKTDEGVRISVRDIRFVADSADILREERDRLDTIARALLTVPDGRFLVEGHTASTGNPTGEQTLSVSRAKKIIDELCRRGLRPEQFIYRGLGGTVPIGDNGTPEGRALNRRVEITVLN